MTIGQTSLHKVKKTTSYCYFLQKMICQSSNEDFPCRSQGPGRGRPPGGSPARSAAAWAAAAANSCRRRTRGRGGRPAAESTDRSSCCLSRKRKYGT